MLSQYAHDHVKMGEGLVQSGLRSVKSDPSPIYWQPEHQNLEDSVDSCTECCLPLLLDFSSSGDERESRDEPYSQQVQSIVNFVDCLCTPDSLCLHHELKIAEVGPIKFLQSTVGHSAQFLSVLCSDPMSFIDNSHSFTSSSIEYKPTDDNDGIHYWSLCRSTFSDIHVPKLRRLFP